MPEVNQSFNPDYSKGLDIESLISAPLVAVSKANVIMAQGQTRFLLEYCFKKNEEDDSYEPVLIKMAISKSVISNTPPQLPPAENDAAENEEPKSLPATNTSLKRIENITTYFNLPLLTIIPLNSLVVDKVNIDFDMEISTSVIRQTGTANGSDNTITEKKAQLFGKITNDSGSGNNKRQTNSKITVNLNAASLPLPSGVLSIIDMYTKSIHLSSTENNSQS